MIAIEIESRQSIKNADGLIEAVGWHSAAVFEAGEHRDGDRLSINKTTEVIVLTDPYPEYKKFVFKDGEFMHSSALLTMEYEGVFKQNLNDYGEADVVPLADIDCIKRNKNGIPEHKGR